MAVAQYDVTTEQDTMTFEFVSVGERGAIKKRVQYTATDVPNVFNLGFGDVLALNDEIDDEAISNNGDSQKVLATVAATALIFTEHYPNALIYAVGTTPVRTRLYRMGIANNIEEIRKNFIVYGLQNGLWNIFKPNHNYEAFLVQRIQ